MFDTYPTHWRYRPLRHTDPPLVGPDVYSLQLALNHVGNFAIALEPDGVLGPKSGRAIAGAQRKLGIADDGIAGPATQRALALRIGKELKGPLPAGLPGGQIGWESGFFLGNYSPQRSDGSYDAGLCQRNTNLTPPREGFDPIASVNALVARVADHYELFEGLPERRRWELAAGSWNAPAFACHYARREGAGQVRSSQTATPSAAAAEAFAAYVAGATAYLRV